MPTFLKSQAEIGAMRSRAEASSTTGAEAAVATESTILAGASANSASPESKNTKRGRNRHNPKTIPPNDALGMLKAAMFQCQKSGIGIGVVSLPKRLLPSVGVVLENVTVCGKCGTMTVGVSDAPCQVCENSA